ncbi:LCP family protein [Actinomyces sp. zg328]|uniref:LCP family protein n=1 Tax=Actinomyces sp. zg328 TaxID=2609287 RepID=UPI001F3BFF36|nr:LCP family protein [Actinomyces sp. zg328]
MTSNDGLPPSVTPGSGGRPAGPPRVPRAVGQGQQPDPRPAPEAPARRSVLGGNQAQAGPRPPAPTAVPRQRPAPPSGGSHARPGSSALALGAAPRRPAPDATRALPSGHPDTLPAPYGPVRPDLPSGPISPGRRAPRRRRWRRALGWTALVIALVLGVIVGRVAWLAHEVDDKLGRVDALSGKKDTAGETWLIVGSDARGDGGIADDGTEGSRADSIMLLHRNNGQSSLTTLPRDTYVEIPGHGGDKINAAYAYGGPELLVQTVERLSGLTIDHYMEVGMAGVKETVDAVDGIDACLDYDVDDRDSGLVWDTSKGTCQHIDGEKALAYSRMRKSDPTGDIGRGLRQRAVISAVVDRAVSAKTLISWPRQDKLVDAGTKALTADKDTGLTDIGKMVLGFREASSQGLAGAPPIDSLDYEPGGIGAAVLLKDETAPDFFSKLRAGRLTSSDFNKIEPTS